ncbi:hypothetical protein [Actinacidiphila glaucinigra]|uniref:hypothetical protein n=1 Tax=Actinacidiphila glaucinigra TaxID=235986 RepID=UPI0035E200CB
MATTHELTSPDARPRARHAAPPRSRPHSEIRLLACLAALFTAVQLLLVVAPGMGLGWDESVYVSQVSPDIPSAFFSAPRSRGVPALVAPLALLTASTLALRVYLAVLSGAALFLALWLWRPLLGTRVVALGGLLFSGLWVTLLYGPQAMPNLWVALVALIAVGCYLRAAAPGHTGRAALAGLGAAFAALTLLRPHDAAWLALPLGVAALFLPGRRRLVLLAVIAAGVLLGGAQWVVEAFTAYGGILARMDRANAIEGGLGWHLAFADQLSTLDASHTLCRPCDAVWQHKGDAVWWFALPALVAAGVALAPRREGQAPGARFLPAVCGLSLALPYLVLIDYAAPRFLLPAYALLALPAAQCLLLLPGRVRPALRPAVAGAVVAVVLAQLVTQQIVLHRAVRSSTIGNGDYARMAAELTRLGVRPPCLVTGPMATPVGYQARCASGQTAGHNENLTPDGVLRLARTQPVAVLTPPNGQPPAYARDWPSRPLPNLRYHPGYRVHLSPR